MIFNINKIFQNWTKNWYNLNPSLLAEENEMLRHSIYTYKEGVIIFSDIFNDKLTACMYDNYRFNSRDNKTIIFGCEFDQSVDILFDIVGISIIEFGENFNQSVNKLPSSVENIIFGRCFNNNVDYLPEKLSSIKFGDFFNKSIDNLPINIKIIFFGSHFCQKIDNLPIGIEILKINNNILKNVNYLPNSVKILIFVNIYESNISNLPISIKKIYVNSTIEMPFDNFPKKITHLILRTTSEYHKYAFINFKNFPCLEFVTINGRYEYTLDTLPVSLTHLEFDDIVMYKHTLDKLSSSIRYLLFNDCEHSYIINFNKLPTSIEYLYLNNYYDPKFVKISMNLKYLHLASGFKFPLNMLPDPPTTIIFNKNCSERYISTISNKIIINDSLYDIILLKLESRLIVYDTHVADYVNNEIILFQPYLNINCPDE